MVQRQLAASLAALPSTEREPALASLVAVAGADPIVADMVLSSLEGRENAFLARVLRATSAQNAPVATVQALAAGEIGRAHV